MITRNRTRTTLSLASVAMAMLVLSTASANAALVVEEQFIYEAGQLNGLNGGIGFDGPWVATKSHGRDYQVGITEFAEPKELNADTGLSFSTLRVAGSALSRYGNAGRAEAHRLLSGASQAALTRDGTTIWFSQLFQGTPDNRNAMFIFGTQPFSHTPGYQLAAAGDGFGFTTANINSDGTGGAGDGSISAIAFDNSTGAIFVQGTYTPDPLTATLLIVGKINWKPNGTPDELFLFNVADLSTEPAESEAFASIMMDFDQSAFNMLAMYDGTDSVTDEIRFGNIFTDVMGVLEKACNPDPEDGAIIETTWVNLSWSSGGSAISHDVYMGDNFDDVNDGTGDTFRGNQDSTFFVAGFPGFAYPDGLVPGTTYYWCIDEVNEANPNSPWKGDVWSFLIPLRMAYEPSPSDGAKFIDVDVELSWTAGFNAKLHTVYFGDDFDTVSNAVDGISQATTTYTPPALLELDETYYWRVDEFDGIQTYTGNVWSFSTLPDIPITDPNLVGWWKFEAGEGTKVVDFSGHGNHGTIVDKVLWVPGQFNLALEFLGDNIGHVELPARMVTTASGSVAMWVNTDQTGDVLSEGMFWYGTETGGDGFGGENEIHIHSQGSGALGFALEGATDVRLDGPMLAGRGWNHVAATWDQVDGCRLYFNGVQVDFQIYTGNVADLAVIRLGRPASNFRFHDGLLDDVRLFDIAISADQVSEIMTKGEDPLKAGAPNPRNNALVSIDEALPLTWSPGEMAAEHDVYFGLDKDAVTNADASDTTGIYRGRQSTTMYTPPEGVEWDGGPYYWRIDESNTDGTITTGGIWSFTVTDFILVDDFESYTDNDANNEAIWQHWIDGFNVPDNGSQVGELMPPYAEQTIVHGGGQCMPLHYNNTGGVTNSEGVLALTAPRDWTRHDVANLSLWIRGTSANAADPLYVSIANSSGSPAIVANEDPAIATVTDWTEWVIPLQAVADQGINLTNVDKIAIGLGSKGGVATGGSGTMYIDDIRLYQP